MENEKVNRNAILEDDSARTQEYRHNFIDNPWDDRSKRSKIGIIALLVAIFVATMACVINSLLSHYKGPPTNKVASNNMIICYHVKTLDYPYVARIHLISTHELLCVGAVISVNTILANEVCTRSGPIRIHLGSSSEQHCKKGFTVDIMQMILGIVSEKFVVLNSHENLAACARVIPFGTRINWNKPAYIIGRPLHGDKLLSRQPTTLLGRGNCTGRSDAQDELICAEILVQCPVRTGDLLIQRNRLIGLALTNVHKRKENNQIAFFTDLGLIRPDLKELEIIL